jgi:hypothetical protein
VFRGVETRYKHDPPRVLVRQKWSEFPSGYCDVYSQIIIDRPHMAWELSVKNIDGYRDIAMG